MRKIHVFDTTLRDGEQSPGVHLTTDEKVKIALQLEKLGVDRIEAGFPASSPGEIVSVKEVSRVVKNASIAALSRANQKDIEAARDALKGAATPCLHIVLATSPIHRKYKLNMTKEQVLEAAESSIRYGKKYFNEIEFSCEDASRTEIEFLYEIVRTAIKAGATVVNLPDTVGYASPETFGHMFKQIKENVPGIEKILLSTHCHNDLGMATANTLAAIYNGVDQIEGTINGIGERAGNTAIEEVALALETRSDVYQAKTSLVLNEIYATSRMVSKMTGMMVQRNKAIVGDHAFSHESGIHQDGMLKEPTTYEIIRPETIGIASSTLVLGKHSGRHALKEKIKSMGFDLSKDEITAVFHEFKNLVDKKKYVVDEDIRALVDQQMVHDTEGFSLTDISIAYPNQQAEVSVILEDRTSNVYEATVQGNGAIDALFQAIDQAIDTTFSLEDYTIRSNTAGKDALGEVYVVLEKDGREVQGRGIDTDIIKASAQAYIKAINRYYENREKQQVGSSDYSFTI
ncbi:2-isopropylmalate synthase [Aneurinibacillus migulanus]|uniref:2-isopropylmalate synthase n=1 Tax=Aneurinibacillus migulanus TaxID=47500 RepID=UPI0020A0941E|nr:2-isopropylmalate synthase [Aneurinibacillus migulanus]MCP1358140.1 2-isopropylmalate synthase [Aneurinibacillus migulanus]